MLVSSMSNLAKKPLQAKDQVASLRTFEIKAKEARDREGYLRYPQVCEEFLVWESEAVWPAE